MRQMEVEAVNDWFSWNGVKCTEYGIHVVEQPPPTIPLERVSYTSVPGRPGSLTILEGETVYDDMVLAVQCLLADPAQIPAIAAWLRGSGKVAFANRQGGFYYARVANQISFERYCAGIRIARLPSTSAASPSVRRSRPAAAVRALHAGGIPASSGGAGDHGAGERKPWCWRWGMCR